MPYTGFSAPKPEITGGQPHAPRPHQGGMKMQVWIENKKTGKYELVNENGVLFEAYNIDVARLLNREQPELIPQGLAELIAEA